ncbi:MAG: ABC transporter permease subunit [Proteobacteria bacterium]|nr:ABC transporter permease subunit [Pseudomonadota bacterium]
MDYLFDSLYSAILLTLSLDRELFSIVGVSLYVSLSSTIFASILGIPFGFLVAFRNFLGKRVLITILNTLLALPTVTVGLFIYSILSRRGVLGVLDLLYTKQAIIIGQTFLITPMVASYTIAAISQLDDRYRKTAMTLGANGWQRSLVVLREARYALAAVVIAAFGRVISEVGISMMVGGNVRGFTRTITTAMALEYDKGQFTLAVALGIILLALALGMNIIFHLFQGQVKK